MELKIEDVQVTVDYVKDGDITFNLVLVTPSGADCINAAAALKQSKDADAFLHWAVESIIDEDYEQLMECEKSGGGSRTVTDEVLAAYVAKALCRRVNEILAEVKVQ